MNVCIGCDHRGFEAKKRLLPILQKLGHRIHDFGCDAPSPCDYPDYAAPLAKAVAAGNYEVGILLDGSGIGMSIVANKIPGVRAALVHDEVTAHIAREQNHCNVLCLGVDLLSEEQVRKITEIFLIGQLIDGRHTRRIAKIAQLEKELKEGK
jgi:ribose 5-phosphate isomerase B